MHSDLGIVYMQVGAKYDEANKEFTAAIAHQEKLRKDNPKGG